jgi:uncharacterized protein with ParB-like and HNH nuclease domain
MSKALYNIKELFKDSGIKQIIVPEIQRDYVWQTKNVEKLLRSIVDDATANAGEKQEKIRSQLEIVSPEIREILERELKANEVYSNIGFIYAYEDKEFKNRYFLIDGQQRITTIYLLLLAVCIKNEKKDYFISNYFVDNLPKVDYKVREDSHIFMLSFISYLLKGGEVDEVKNQSWYYDSYNNDRTISSLLRNYEIIENYIASKDISIEYVEENIQIWFFDINKSQQGEELYIYMNSRGEEVKANENIKAGLLEACSEEEKNTWGAKWEDWQDFFWKQKEASNADVGFNEFIRWIIIIEHIKSQNSQPVEKLGKFIKEIRQNDKFSSELLELKTIETYFKSLLFLNNNKDLCEKAWLSGRTSMLDYLRLFPALMYLNDTERQDVQSLKRLMRFFKNVARLEDVAKNPDNQTVNAIRLMQNFLSDTFTDVVDLINYKDENSAFSSILTKEELYKLSIFKNPPEEVTRGDIEELFWKAEDFNLLNGQLAFIFKASGDKMEDEKLFKYECFKSFVDAFTSLLKKTNDNFRRALLTKGDYTVYDGYSTSLASERFSFGHSIPSWKEIINDHGSILISFFVDYIQKKRLLKSDMLALEEIIDTYLSKNANNDTWIKTFIENPEVLEYCEQKKICWRSESASDIFLLKKNKATTYKSLESFNQQLVK